MCMNPTLKAQLEVRLTVIESEIEKECDLMRQSATGGTSEAFRTLMDNKREVKQQIEDIPHRFEIGDGAHTANNGDCYPVKVVSVSKSGKSIEVVDMGHRAVKPEDGSELQVGHQSWEVYDLDQTFGTSTYTLRKNGRWIREGCSLKDYWMGLHEGAYYSYNWEV